MEQNWEINMLNSIAISFPLLNSVLSNVGETFFVSMVLPWQPDIIALYSLEILVNIKYQGKADLWKIYVVHQIRLERELCMRLQLEE